MKKILTLLLLIVTFSVFVTAANWTSEAGPVTLREGWNLVYGLQTLDQLEGQALEKEHVKAIYGFIPTTQEYIRAHPNPDGEAWEKLDDVYDDHKLLQTAFWVYVDEGITTKYWTYKEPSSFEERTLYPGWNFVAITSNMGDYSINQVKGSCNFDKIYHFEAIVQEWVDITNSESIDNKLAETSIMNSGILIKTSEECNLGVSEEVISPPPIPN